MIFTNQKETLIFCFFRVLFDSLLELSSLLCLISYYIKAFILHILQNWSLLNYFRFRLNFFGVFFYFFHAIWFVYISAKFKKPRLHSLLFVNASLHTILIFHFLIKILHTFGVFLMFFLYINTEKLASYQRCCL